MPDARGRLTADEFRTALEALDETQASFARLLQDLGDGAADKDRTVQRWASGDRDVPGPIAAVLTLLGVLRQAGIDGDQLRALLEDGATFPWLPEFGAAGEAVIMEDRRK